MSRLPLLEDELALLEAPLVHALHHVSDLLHLQPFQVLILIQSFYQELLHTGKHSNASGLEPLKPLGVA